MTAMIKNNQCSTFAGDSSGFGLTFVFATARHLSESEHDRDMLMWSFSKISGIFRPVQVTPWCFKVFFQLRALSIQIHYKSFKIL